jgi:hypothetical protein
MPDTPKSDGKKMESIPDVTKIIGDKTPGASTDAARDELEQRRTILQNMKDFDFQIKKNQEDVTNLNEKVENLSKDLDDLVSLYEIVSEQMNPFVGLSKVTKKRLDALENFTKEVDMVKTRIGDLESVMEKGGLNSGGASTTLVKKPVSEIKPTPEAPKEKTENPIPQVPTVPSIPATPTNEIKPTPSVPPVPPITSSPVLPLNEIKTTLSPIQPQMKPSVVPNLSDRELDELLSRSLESLVIEQNIDNMINDFFLSLK